MAWAQELKNLTGEIKTSHKDRTDKIKEIKKHTRDFLVKSEENRKADFKATMEVVIGAVAKIQRRVKRMLDEYSAERKEAAGYWASLAGRKVALEK